MRVKFLRFYEAFFFSIINENDIVFQASSY